MTIRPNSVERSEHHAREHGRSAARARGCPVHPRPLPGFEVPAASYIAALRRPPAHLWVRPSPLTRAPRALECPSTARRHPRRPARRGHARASLHADGTLGPAGPGLARPAPAPTPLPPSRNGPDGASSTMRTAPSAVAVLDPVESRDTPPSPHARGLPVSLVAAGDRPMAAGPCCHGRPQERAERGPGRSAGRFRSPGGAERTPPPTDATPDSDPCATSRILADERCSPPPTAADQARAAADALRDAQRAYDNLRERVRARPGRRRPAAHRRRHRPRCTASSGPPPRPQCAHDTEAAAPDWLTQINGVTPRARDALRLAEAGSAELRGGAAPPRADGRRGARGADQRGDGSGWRLQWRSERGRSLEEAELAFTGGWTPSPPPPRLCATHAPRPSGAARPVVRPTGCAAVQQACPGWRARLVRLRILRGRRRRALIALFAAPSRAVTPKLSAQWERALRSSSGRSRRAPSRTATSTPPRTTPPVDVPPRESREIVAALRPSDSGSMARAASPTSGSPPSVTSRWRSATPASTGCGSATGRASRSWPTSTGTPTPRRTSGSRTTPAT